MFPMLYVAIPLVAIASSFLFRYLIELIRVSELQSKAVFITGCDSGFGRLLALKCARAGITVFAGCLTVEGVESMRISANEEDLNISALVHDVTSDESTKNAVEFVEENLCGKQLWALVNNAGVFCAYGPDDWCRTGDYCKSLNVNTVGLIRTTHVSSPLYHLGGNIRTSDSQKLVSDPGNDSDMNDATEICNSFHNLAKLALSVRCHGSGTRKFSKSRKREAWRRGLEAFEPLIKRSKGRIVTVTSAISRVAVPGLGPYCISKFASRAYIDILRQEMRAFGVKCIVLEPGLFRTALASVEAMQQRLDFAWERMSAAERNEYGEQYKSNYERNMAVVLKLASSPRIDSVVDAYFHAITARFPRLRYTVGWDAICLYRPLAALPSYISDLIMNGFTLLTTKPAALNECDLEAIQSSRSRLNSTA